MSMPPPRHLPRGKSSSSLSSEGKKKPLKQFTAGGIKSHSRNSSYGQLNKLNKLTRISSVESVEDANDQRPSMSRSKSSDGVILKRNRSKTKLTGLQPLTRTISSQSYKARNFKAPRSQVKFNSGESESEEEVDEFEDDSTVRLHSESSSNINGLGSQQQPQQQQSQDDKEQLQQQDIDNSIPKYFGNILSQSTGMERSIVPSESVTHSLNNSVSRQQQHHDFPGLNRYPSKSSLNQIAESRDESYAIGNSRLPRSMARDEPNESLSSFQSSSNLIFQPSSTNIARHYNQQINSQYQMSALHKDPRGSSNSLATDFTKNFREFLNKTPELETRTQQKLWLQRENSILDLTQASKNYDLNNAQFRTEFEKFSREYLNVRRHVNPVLGSLKRLENFDQGSFKFNEGSQDLSSFDKFAPGLIDKIRRNHSELNQIWEVGWRNYNTSSTSLNNLTRPSQQKQESQQQQLKQSQPRPKPQQRPSNHITLSSPQLPMTRAVAKNGGASII